MEHPGTDRPAPKTKRPLVLACILVCMAIVAIEATIVSTAMPSIAAKLGGFALYSWVFTAFLLTQATTTVMFGKLADLYGRKPVLMGGLGVFLIGSLLCGLAWSMESLIAFRLLQGVGAGSIMPVLITLLGDLYTPEERLGAQAYISSVWGVSALVGPLMGALIVQYLSWQWVFWINIPIGLAVIGVLAFSLHERFERRKPALDIGGAVLCFIAISALLVVLTEGGGKRPGLLIGGLAVFLAALPALLWVELRARDPMIPLNLWKQPAILNTNLAIFAGGMVFTGATAFLPVYVQGVMGRSAAEAGLAITVMTLTWPAASLLYRMVFKGGDIAYVCRAGGVLIVIATLIFPFLRPDQGLWLLCVGSGFLGAGMGLLFNSALVLVQESVDWVQRGSATASSLFSRTLGSMIGAGMLGGVLNGALQFFAGRNHVSPDRAGHLLDQGGSVALTGADLPLLRLALHQSMVAIFCVMAALALVIVAAGWRILLKRDGRGGIA